MKKIIIVLVIVLLLVIIGIIVLLNRNNKKIDINTQNIKRIRLSYSNGYGKDENVSYSIELKDNKYILGVKLYEVSEEETVYKEITIEDLELIVNCLNENEVYKWNNFHKSDKNVLDGDGFSFSITTTDNESISASGYMMWPKNYSKVKSVFNEVLDKYAN